MPEAFDRVDSVDGYVAERVAVQYEIGGEPDSLV